VSTTAKQKKLPRKGVVHGMPFPEYLSGPEESFSGLKHMAVNPATYRYWKDAPEKKETDAMRFGQALHAAVLEPDTVEDRFVVLPEGMVRNAKHAKYQDFMAEHEGKTVLTAAQGERLGATMASVRTNTMLLGLLRGLQTEVSMFWGKEAGIKLRGRLDGHSEPQALLVDLKSIQAVDDRTIQRQFSAFKYPAQQALYQAGAAKCGLDFRGFLFVVIATEAPFDVRMIKLTEKDLEIGWLQVKSWMERLAACQVTQLWPGHGNQVDVIEMPPWYGTDGE